MNEREWKAQADADALARAAEVRADSQRHKAAQTAAQKMLSEQQAKLNGLRAAAGGRNSASSAPKPQGGSTFWNSR